MKHPKLRARGNALVTKGKNRLDLLDALRGFAAAVVVWHHIVKLYPSQFAPLNEISPFLYQLAHLMSDQHNNAVMLFFVLSGFSIRLSLKDDLLETEGSVRTYCWRRSIRILPLYWFALLWSAVFGLAFLGTQHASFSAATLLGNLAFLQTSASAAGAWFQPFGLNGPLWSLSYEVFYYALFPIVMLTYRALRQRSLSSEALLIVSFFTAIIALAVNRELPSPFSNFLILWHVWVLGYYVCDCWIRNKLSVLAAISVALLLALGAALNWLELSSDTLKSLRNGSIIALLGSLLAWQSKNGGLGAISAIGSVFNFLFVKIGAGSYALYLLHYPLLLAFTSPQSTALFPVELTSAWLVCGVMLVMAVFVCPALEGLFLRLKGLRLRLASDK